jgi:hypothetical protein
MKRFILMAVLAIEGLGGILGGSLLVIAPDGHLMQMPVGIMHGTFADFFIPGLILTGMGLLTSAAFFAVLRRSQIDWLLSGLSLVGYTIWFTVEIAILRELHWLHIVWGSPILAGLWGAYPLVPEGKISRLTRSIYHKESRSFS